MRILYLTDQTFLHGGVEKVLSQKANYLADELNDEVFIITYRQQNYKSCYDFSNKIKFFDLGIDYEIEKSYFHPVNLKKIPKHYTEVQKMILDLKPDVIISCSFGPDFHFLPYIEKGVPKIKEFHSSRYYYKKHIESVKDKLLLRLSSHTEKKYHQIVVLNESEQQYYNTDNISIIPNPAEFSSRKSSCSNKRILAAGRISPVKNFGDLIKIFSRLSHQFPDWELHFFGDDYMGTQKKLEIIVGEHHLINQIKFKGVTNNLKNEMLNYSIYAMTSETECFPMVLLESLSMGVPVISYDAPTGPKHILTDNEDSFLITPQNKDSFADKLKFLMQNEKVRQEMGEKGARNVQRFDIEMVMGQWKKLFNSFKEL